MTPKEWKCWSARIARKGQAHRADPGRGEAIGPPTPPTRVNRRKMQRGCAIKGWMTCTFHACLFRNLIEGIIWVRKLASAFSCFVFYGSFFFWHTFRPWLSAWLNRLGAKSGVVVFLLVCLSLSREVFILFYLVFCFRVRWACMYLVFSGNEGPAAYNLVIPDSISRFSSLLLPDAFHVTHSFKFFVILILIFILIFLSACFSVIFPIYILPHISTRATIARSTSLYFLVSTRTQLN